MSSAPATAGPATGAPVPLARPRVLLVVHSAKPGGAQLVALGQARALAQHHDLTIAIDEGPLRGAFAELGDVVDGAPRLPVWGAARSRWALQAARTAADAVRLARLIRRRHIAAVVTNSSIVVSPVLAARLARVPALAQVQEGPTLQGAGRLLALHGRLARTVVVISPALAAGLAGARARTVVSPVGVAIGPPPPPSVRRAGDPLALLMVAGLDRNKGQDVAVAALGELVAAGVDGSLTLAGPPADAAYAAEVRAAAQRLGVADRVHLLGARDDVPDLLRAADVLVVASHAELTPLVLMEALAQRTPVVATAVGGVPDVVLDGETGLLVAPGDPAALAAALARLAADPALAARLADRGRRHVEERFDERHAHARLAGELAHLLAPRG